MVSNAMYIKDLHFTTTYKRVSRSLKQPVTRNSQTDPKNQLRVYIGTMAQ